MLSDNEEKLVERLRKEAVDVKDCFARYSLQAMTLVAPLLGVIVTLEANRWPLAGLASIPVIVLLLAICRIGTYKYATANRLNGFELHLHRLDCLPDSLRSRWDSQARAMSWEEGMRAWRTVQATVYRSLYQSWRWLPQRPRREWRKAESRWWEPNHLVGDAVYHTGQYLRTLMKVLYAMMAFAYACLAWTAVAVVGNPAQSTAVTWTIVVATILIGCRVLLAMSQIRSRITSLESGILSIHSCSIMWHAVAVAHVRALESLFAARGQQGLKGYHREIGRLALDLAARPLSIHEWVCGETASNDALEPTARS